MTRFGGCPAGARRVPAAICVESLVRVFARCVAHEGLLLDPGSDETGGRGSNQDCKVVWSGYACGVIPIQRNANDAVALCESLYAGPGMPGPL